MVLHNYECPEGHISEKFVRIGKNGKAPGKRCEVGECGKIAERVFLPKRRDAQPFEPTYYDIDASGNVRAIMSKDAPTRPGFERRAITTLGEYRKLVKHMSGKDREKWEKVKEGEEIAFEEARKERRAELRDLSRHFTPFGRDFAAYVMEENMNKRPERYEPGVRIEVYE